MAFPIAKQTATRMIGLLHSNYRSLMNSTDSIGFLYVETLASRLNVMVDRISEINEFVPTRALSDEQLTWASPFGLVGKKPNDLVYTSLEEARRNSQYGKDAAFLQISRGREEIVDIVNGQGKSLYYGGN